MDVMNINAGHSVRSPVNVPIYGGGNRAGYDMAAIIAAHQNRIPPPPDDSVMGLLRQLLGGGQPNTSVSMRGNVLRAQQRPVIHDRYASETASLQAQIAAEEAAYRRKYGNTI